MANAGISTMENLRESVGEIPTWYADYASHPTFADRITELKKGMTTIEETAARFDAGVAMLESGREDQAVVAFQEYLTLFPHSSAGWTNLCGAWLRKAMKGDSDPFVDDLPIRRDPGKERALDPVNRERARDACEQALQIDPNRPEALTLLGVLARREGFPDDAAVFADRALELEPASPVLLNNRGNIHASAKELGLAVERYDEALELDPARPWTRANRALALTLAGKKKPAIEAWLTLVDDPDYEMAALAGLDQLGARKAVDKQRKKQAKKAAKVEPASIGDLALEQSRADMEAILGEASFCDVDDDELYAFCTWGRVGVTFLLDAAVTVTVRAPSDLQAQGVGMGASEQQVVSALGRPDDAWTMGHRTTLRYDGRRLVVYLSPDGVDAMQLAKPPE